jgi:hypothetical protein
VAARADVWLSNITAQMQRASKRKMKKHTRDRFFVFDPTAMPLSKSCFGKGQFNRPPPVQTVKAKLPLVSTN